ncbi:MULTISPECIES: alpha/beta fold hydrolase [Listeria]|uniref:alpha/beta fold hydrolase n=1 Tax=Listeria TaxID=1637 RepID=UPI000B598321|nr:MULTISPECIES: alpha/beta hydrolase [Listeria]
MYKEMKLKTHDNSALHLYVWDEVENPIGIVQIVHGMSEHGARYNLFAETLNKAGYIALADDHRGFGKTALNKSELGHIEPSDSVRKMVLDERAVQLYAQENYPNLPYFVFAHSMGSFIIRLFMAEFKADGVILCGSGMQPPLLLTAAKWISSKRIKKNAARRSEILNKLAFWGYNRTYHEPSNFSWLTRDRHIQAAYEKDPFGGPIVGTSGFFHTLFTVIAESQAETTFERVPEDLPLLFLSGTADPVGHYGKDIPKLAVTLAENGVSDVTYKLYEGARHELINETCKETVFADIIRWIKRKTSS